MHRHPAISYVSAAIALAVALSVAAAMLNDTENLGHAADHLAIATPMLLLVIAIRQRVGPPKPTRIGRSGRHALIAGLILVGGSLLLEAIGAFGYDGDDSRIGFLTSLHNGVWMIQFPGALVLMIGAVLAMLSLGQNRATSSA